MERRASFDSLRAETPQGPKLKPGSSVGFKENDDRDGGSVGDFGCLPPKIRFALRALKSI